MTLTVGLLLVLLLSACGGTAAPPSGGPTAASAATSGGSSPAASQLAAGSSSKPAPSSASKPTASASAKPATATSSAAKPAASAAAKPAAAVPVAIPSTPPSGSAQNGQALFTKDGCYECHDYQGEGGSGTGPRLAPNPLPWIAFATQVRTPRQDMPRYPVQFLSDQDLGDIYAYLQSIPAAPAASSIPLLTNR